MRKIILMAAGLIFLNSCQNDDDTEAFTPIEFATVTKSFISSNKIPFGNPSGNFVVTDQAELDALLDRFPDGSASWLIPDQIDFNTRILVFAVDSYHFNGGYDIEIESVTNENGNIVVDVEKYTNPDEEGLLIEMQPIHIISIPITDLPVTFE